MWHHPLFYLTLFAIKTTIKNLDSLEAVGVVGSQVTGLWGPMRKLCFIRIEVSGVTFTDMEVNYMLPRQLGSQTVVQKQVEL